MRQIPHIGFLSVTVSVIVMGIPRGKLFLQVSIFPGRVRMRSQVIPNSQVTFDLRLAVLFEDVDMVSASISLLRAHMDHTGYSLLFPLPSVYQIVSVLDTFLTVFWQS